MSDSEYVPEPLPEEQPENDQPEKLDVTLSNKMYNWLKFIAQIALPAVATLYLVIAGLWDLPEPEKVAGTIMAIDAFLGVLLGISSKQYSSATEGQMVGFLNVSESAQGKRMELEFPGDPHDIDRHDKVTFKVRRD
jgi:hypothetical protein